MISSSRSSRLLDKIRAWLPALVLSPSFAAILLFVYGFIIFSGYLSFTDSRLLPSFDFVGLVNYQKLLGLRHWNTALTNLAIFGGLYISICVILGLLLAILLDQKIRVEGILRPIYLYPMALSFIVTGTAWKWFLDPGFGLEHTMQTWGFLDFQFRWIKDRAAPLGEEKEDTVWATGIWHDASNSRPEFNEFVWETVEKIRRTGTI